MIDIFAYIGGVFAMVSFVPQMVKAVRTRSTGDLSWLILTATLISVTAYEIYAWLLWLVPVIIFNGIFIVSVIATMVLKYYFDRIEPASRYALGFEAT